MEGSFKLNIYFDAEGEELETIIANYILQNKE